MTIRIVCPGCQKSLKTGDDAAGRKLRCPGCNQVLAIPAADASSSDPELISIAPPPPIAPAPPISRVRKKKVAPKPQRPVDDEEEAEPNDEDAALGDRRMSLMIGVPGLILISVGQFSGLWFLTAIGVILETFGFAFYSRAKGWPLASGLLLLIPCLGLIILAFLPDQRSRERRPGFDLVQTVVVFVILHVLVALLLPAVQRAREAASGKSQSKDHLRKIGLALHEFHDANRAFPSGTHPNDNLVPERRMSWLVEILPYVGQKTLYEGIDMTKSWDDPVNQAAVKTPIGAFLYPRTSPSDPANNITHYVGIAGVGQDAPLSTAPANKIGVFGYDRKTRIQDITDGTLNTIMVSEAQSKYGPWAAGGSSNVRALTAQPYVNGPDGLGSPYSGGFHVLFSEGSVQFLSEDIDPSVLEALSTRAGGEVVSAPWTTSQGN